MARVRRPGLSEGVMSQVSLWMKPTIGGGALGRGRLKTSSQSSGDRHYPALEHFPPKKSLGDPKNGS